MRKDTRTKIEKIIERHNKFKGCYFWTPPGSASGRRSMEKYESCELYFTHRKAKYAVKQTVECSYKNVYYSLYVTVDGVKKNVRALKSALKTKKG